MTLPKAIPIVLALIPVNTDWQTDICVNRLSHRVLTAFTETFIGSAVGKVYLSKHGWRSVCRSLRIGNSRKPLFKVTTSLTPLRQADIVLVMKLDPAQVRRWMSNFDAAKEVERDLVQKEGPRSAWSIETALSLIAAAERQRSRLEADPLRERQEEAVCAIWARLRQRMVA